MSIRLLICIVVIFFTFSFLTAEKANGTPVASGSFTCNAIHTICDDGTGRYICRLGDPLCVCSSSCGPGTDGPWAILSGPTCPDPMALCVPCDIASYSCSIAPDACLNNSNCGTNRECCAGSPNYCSNTCYRCDGSYACAPPTTTPIPLPTSTPTPIATCNFDGVRCGGYDSYSNGAGCGGAYQDRFLCSDGSYNFVSCSTQACIDACKTCSWCAPGTGSCGILNSTPTPVPTTPPGATSTPIPTPGGPTPTIGGGGSCLIPPGSQYYYYTSCDNANENICWLNAGTCYVECEACVYGCQPSGVYSGTGFRPPGSCKSAGPLCTMTLSPSNLNLAIGQSAVVTATYTQYSALPLDFIAFTSSNNSLMSVSPLQVGNGHYPYSTTVTARNTGSGSINAAAYLFYETTGSYYICGSANSVTVQIGLFVTTTGGTAASTTTINTTGTSTTDATTGIQYAVAYEDATANPSITAATSCSSLRSQHSTTLSSIGSSLTNYSLADTLTGLLPGHLYYFCYYLRYSDFSGYKYVYSPQTFSATTNSLPVSCSTTFSGNVVVNPTSTNCTSLGTLGGTLYSNTGLTVSAFNGSSPAKSTVSVVSGAYSGLTYAPTCGSRAGITLERSPYVVTGVCDNGVYMPQTGWGTSYPYFNSNLATSTRTITFLTFNKDPWFQTDVGDVRFEAINNPIPGPNKAAIGDTVGNNSSLFISSSNSSTPFNSFTPSIKNWQVGNEYSYNNDFETGLGGTSYSFYVSQANKRGIPIVDKAPATTVDVSTLTSGVYSYPNNTTISTSAPIATKHIVLLVKGNATISNNIKVTAGTNALFIVAAQKDLTIAESVGGSPVAQTPGSVTTNLDGIYTAEGSILLPSTANCTVPTPNLQLNIGGALVANSLHPFARGQSGAVQNFRRLCQQDATLPSYAVYSRPDFLTQLTDFYKTTYKTIKEVEP